MTMAEIEEMGPSELEALAALTAEAEQLDGAAAPPPPEPPPQPRVESRLVLREMLPLFAHAITPALSEFECNLLADKAGAVLDKWFPDSGLLGFMDKWKEEIALLAAVKMIVDARRPPAPEPKGRHEQQE